MTILDKLARQMGNRIKAKGLTVYVVQSHNKHPRQNTMLANLTTKLIAEGVDSVLKAQNFTSAIDRGVLILWDDKRNLETRGQWDKIINAPYPPLRWIISLGAGFEEDDFEGDWNLVETFDLHDTDGDEDDLQVWKRIKVKI